MLKDSPPPFDPWDGLNPDTDPWEEFAQGRTPAPAESVATTVSGMSYDVIGSELFKAAEACWPTEAEGMERQAVMVCHRPCPVT